MTPASSSELLLLKAFEAALRDGLQLDAAMGGILEAAAHFFDAAVVAVLPAGGAPAVTHSGKSGMASVAAQRLGPMLAQVVTQARPARAVDSGFHLYGAPLGQTELVRGAFGIALTRQGDADVEGAVLLFTRVLSHVLDRERSFSTMRQRRDEAVALLEMSSGVLRATGPEDVIRVAGASLSRELKCDSVLSFRYHPDGGEIEDVRKEEGGARLLSSEPLLARALHASGPLVEETPGGSGAAPACRLAVPLGSKHGVIGFVLLARRRAFSLGAPDMLLAQELVALASIALEHACLIEDERMMGRRTALVASVHTALAGLMDVNAVLKRAVEEIGFHFDLDLCVVRLLPGADSPGTAAAHVKSHLAAGTRTDEIPDALMEHLSSQDSHLLLADVLAHPKGLTLIPAPALAKDLARPIGLLAVPLTYRGALIGALAAVVGGRSRVFSESTLLAFEALAVELSVSVSSVGLVQRERDSHRFLEQLLDLMRAFAATVDETAIKRILSEQAASLLKADACQIWDADSKARSLQLAARFGSDVGAEVGRLVPMEKTSHALVRCFLERAPVVVVDDQARMLFPGSGPAAGPPLVRVVAVPLVFREETLGVLSLCARRGAEPWSADGAARLALLADTGSIALHNARLMKAVERQSDRDEKTGLYNRAAFVKRLETEVRRVGLSGDSIALAHLKLDGLVEAVQKLGQPLVDGLLPGLGAALLKLAGTTSVVGRDRADRFWVLLAGPSKNEAQRLVRSMQADFEAQFGGARLDASGPQLGLTAGIAACPEDSFDTPSLLLRAEEALDDAARMSRGSVVLYGALADDDEFVV
jgi:diguanylate cyclase (GGDEF)-like protein